MQIKVTTSTRKLLKLNKRIRAVSGGTGASKTFSIVMILIDYAQSNKNKHIDIVSVSYPHLEAGVMEDFKNVMQAQQYWKDDRWNSSKHTYTFETGSVIKFMSVDKIGKAHGPRRDVLFLNECNYMPFQVADQLITRTREFVWLDWNPSNDFWFYEEMLGRRDDIDFIGEGGNYEPLTFEDNEGLSEEERKEILSRKHNAAWWRVYGEGKRGEIQGRIYTNWQFIDEIPHEARLERYGVDFGWHPDPAAVVAVYYYNGGYIIDEIAYQLEMSNREIAETLKNLPKALVVADNAEPKSINEIKMYGVNIIPCKKGGDSVRHGIMAVQDQQISVTKRSLNVIKEYRNYLRKIDKDGKVLNEPEHEFSHSMDACFSGDTLVHTTKGEKPIRELVGTSGFLYTRNGMIKLYYDVRKTRENTDVLNIEFEDSSSLVVTPDHLLLRPDGTWIEASLLSVCDMIQCGTYEGNSILQWAKVYITSWGKVFERWKSAYASLCMGVLQRFNTGRYAHSSQGWQSTQQHNRELGAFVKSRTSTTSLSGMVKKLRFDREKKKTLRQDTPLNKGVAFIRRGAGVAQATWRGNIQKKKTRRERVCSLPYEIYNLTIRKVSALLPPELQNESTSKTIKRITRGREDVTYNLEVEDTHCLIANGVVAHNCRYAISSLVPVMRKHEMALNMPSVFTDKKRKNPAR